MSWKPCNTNMMDVADLDASGTGETSSILSSREWVLGNDRQSLQQVDELTDSLPQKVSQASSTGSTGT